jgi:putative inorganic carbon (HCO3(-)) transporter
VSASLGPGLAPTPAIRLPIRAGSVVALGVAVAVVIGSLLAVDPLLGVAGLVAAIFVPVVLLNLPLGVVLWAPLAFINAVPFVSLASMGVLALIAVAWLSVAPARRAFLGEVLLNHSGLAWTLGLLTVWVTISIAWATDPWEATLNVFNWYIAMAGFVAVATTITKPRYLAGLVLALIVGAVLAATVGFAPVDQGPTAQEGRLSGGLGDPNYLAAGLVVALALAAGLSATTRHKGWRGLLFGVMAYLVIALAATGSRGGLLAAGISIVAAVVLVRSGSVRVGVIIVAALAAVGLWTAANSSGTWDRIREFDTRGTGRIDLWDVAWRMSQDHLVAGVGVNNFRAESDNYVRQPGSPSDITLITERPHVVHNIYLQQLAETGIVGLALLLTVLGVTLRTTWRAVKRLESAAAFRLAGLGRSILVAQIGALSASLFLSNAYDPLLWILLALSPVLSTLALQAERRESVVA